MGKVKKYELTLDDEQPFEVYGISTAFADYRLTWELNQMLGIHLEKEQQRFADRPMIDYFLVLRENFSHQPETLIEQLRAINGIVAVFSFNSDEFDILDYLTS